jgi:hypothetical protein
MTKVIDRSTTTIVDAAMLSRGWLAVAAVSGTNGASPALDHTVCIEQFEDEGLRLIATDSYRLLMTWVPAKELIEGRALETGAPDGPWPEEPDVGRVPHATAVAHDPWGRAKGLLAHMAQMATRDENKGIEATVHLGVPWQPEATPKGALQFDGFNALVVDLEYPDRERLHLPTYEGEYPSWRSVMAGFKQGRTANLAMQADSLATIATAAKGYGDHCRIELRFGGENKPVAVSFGDVPKVRGLVMPRRWDLEANAPAGPVE